MTHPEITPQSLPIIQRMATEIKAHPGQPCSMEMGVGEVNEVITQVYREALEVYKSFVTVDGAPQVSIKMVGDSSRRADIQASVNLSNPPGNVSAQFSLWNPTSELGNVSAENLMVTDTLSAETHNIIYAATFGGSIQSIVRNGLKDPREALSKVIGQRLTKESVRLDGFGLYILDDKFVAKFKGSKTK